MVIDLSPLSVKLLAKFHLPLDGAASFCRSVALRMLDLACKHRQENVHVADFTPDLWSALRHVGTRNEGTRNELCSFSYVAQLVLYVACAHCWYYTSVSVGKRRRATLLVVEFCWWWA